MTPIIYYIASLVIATGVLYGIKLLNDPKTAVTGNRTGAVFLLLAIILTMLNANILSFIDIWIALAIGSIIGIIWARKVKMIQMPQLVSAYNGFGGAASMLVAVVLLFHGVNSSFELYSSLAAFLIGSFTFAGSMIATGKLSGKLPQKPIPFKSSTSNLLIVAMIVWLVAPAFAMFETTNIIYILLGLVISVAFGLVLTFRVGGADMPITISLLNSFSGVAGAIAGLAINDPLLVAISGVVGASGLILTQIMCRAMNRNLGEILSGKTTTSDSDKPKNTNQAKVEAVKPTEKKQTDVSSLLNNAKRVIIVPGYGMALAQAQTQVKQLADLLESKGVDVEFAIHPVAGRMPGHMNVLLAEVDVSYERLKEMDDINPLFAETDVAIIVGANDVVNSAANTAVDTPIYGLPILDVDKAKHVIVCNFDDKPGYAGVDNPLYTQENGVTLMWGDAKDSITSLIASANKSGDATETSAGKSDLKEALDNAKRVIIVPGYGMALAQAQTQVKQLADLLESKGVDVEFAIHPVAGRMPGHMNVLLAEVDVSYERLKEMDDINPLFAETDVAIIVGANDVVNSAANTAVDTPIYGLPILDVDKAKHVVVCNFDDKPGYAGVDNPLYIQEKDVTLMWGDAKDSITKLISTVNEESSVVEQNDCNDQLKEVLDNAKRVIIVPGYGMALAQAQTQVKQLADLFESKGVDVEFAIHPVAGRMPGHMNVLLAEVDVSYERLKEMDDINPLFDDTDVAIIVGANDVVNSAANTAVDTPIYGLPILNVDKAKHVIVCNFDDKPGYAGVDNPLYTQESDVTLLWGDAKDSVTKLISKLNEESKPQAKSEQASIKDSFNNAKRVIIVPGYGMALAQAQTQVKQLADLLENKGIEVEFAIHPVAGRMPGHMNVLLAEVDVSYERLREMDEINPLFDDTDVAIIVGANDVVNSAANTAVDTPIYGLPILNVDKAKHVIVCNFDDKPGYAGVDNPLYTQESDVTLLWDDAKESVAKIIQELS